MRPAFTVQCSDVRCVPCVNGGVCSGQGIDAFQCKCVAGYDGYVCSINVAECASEPCLNSGTCSEENVGPDQYARIRKVFLVATSGVVLWMAFKVGVGYLGRSAYV